METSKGAVEIVQIGAPHGVLDLDLRVRIFQEVIPSELVSGDRARNLILFEEAGGFTASQAEKFQRDIKGGKQIIDALFPSSNQRNIDVGVYSALTQAPRAEHQHHAISMAFFDWLIKRYGKSHELDVLPEHYRTEEERKSIRDAAVQGIAPLCASEKKLDDLLTECRERSARIDEQVLTRDKAISDSLTERLRPRLLQRGTRTKVIICMGNAHRGIKTSLDPDFAKDIEYREVMYDEKAEGETVEDGLVDGMSRGDAARILSYGIISAQLKRVFLQIYGDKILKAPGKNAHGKTVFHHAYEVSQSLPIEAVYMFLQELGQVDCGLDKSQYPSIDLPAPFSTQPNDFSDKIVTLVEAYGMEDVSTPEISGFLDRKIVANALFILYEMTDVKLRQAFSVMLDSFSGSDMEELKQELMLSVESRGVIPAPFWQSKVSILLNGSMGLDKISYRQLKAFFSGAP